jgi:hypothetical protein
VQYSFNGFRRRDKLIHLIWFSPGEPLRTSYYHRTVAHSVLYGWLLHFVLPHQSKCVKKHADGVVAYHSVLQGFKLLSSDGCAFCFVWMVATFLTSSIDGVLRRYTHPSKCVKKHANGVMASHSVLQGFKLLSSDGCAFCFVWMVATFLTSSIDGRAPTLHSPKQMCGEKCRRRHVISFCVARVHVSAAAGGLFQHFDHKEGLTSRLLHERRAISLLHLFWV